MTITINGISCYYERHGDPANPPLYFLHGAPGLGDCRSDVRTFLPLEDEYHLVFMDLRGSGRSDESPPYTHEQWVSDIDALREALGHDGIRLHGGSYGGFLALEYALEHPKRVSHLVLRDTAADGLDDEASIRRALDSGLPGIEEEPLRRLFRGEVSSNRELRRMFGAVIPLYSTSVPSEAEVKKQLDSIYFHFRTHNYAFAVNKPKYNLSHRLGELGMPALVNVGEEDWITPASCSRLIAEKIPNATLVIFENCGHMPQIEAREEYLEGMRVFLAS